MFNKHNVILNWLICIDLILFIFTFIYLFFISFIYLLDSKLKHS